MSRQRGRRRGPSGPWYVVLLSKLVGACASQTSAAIAVAKADDGDVIATKNDYELVRRAGQRCTLMPSALRHAQAWVMPFTLPAAEGVLSPPGRLPCQRRRCASGCRRLRGGCRYLRGGCERSLLCCRRWCGPARSWRMPWRCTLGQKVRRLQFARTLRPQSGGLWRAA